MSAFDEHEKGVCPVCGAHILVSDGRHPVVEAGLLLPHNVSWGPPVRGVSRPKLCAGGGRAPVAEAGN